MGQIKAGAGRVFTRGEEIALRARGVGDQEALAAEVDAAIKEVGSQEDRDKLAAYDALVENNAELTKALDVARQAVAPPAKAEFEAAKARVAELEAQIAEMQKPPTPPPPDAAPV